MLFQLTFIEVNTICNCISIYFFYSQKLLDLLILLRKKEKKIVEQTDQLKKQHELINHTLTWPMSRPHVYFLYNVSIFYKHSIPWCVLINQRGKRVMFFFLVPYEYNEWNYDDLYMVIVWWKKMQCDQGWWSLPYFWLSYSSSFFY